MLDLAGVARRGWWLVPLLAPWLVLWPLADAGFTGDDWSFLALARHGDGPAAFFLHDHSFTYLYRPVAMALWWASTAAFGAEPAGHYAINVLLHGGNAALLASLVRAGGATRTVALCAALVFALHPVGAGTAAWLSDRFDLMATLACLAALRLLAGLERHGMWALAGAAVAAAIAAGSKETAIVLVPAAWTWLLVAWYLGRPRGDRATGTGSTGPSARQALAAAAAIALPFVVFLLARRHVLGSWGGVAIDASPLQALWHGASLWLARWPDALAGPGGTPLVGLLAGAAGLLLFLVALHHRLLRGHAPGNRLPALLLAAPVLACAAAAVQAPVVRLALAGEAPFAVTTNLRFYYLALAAACATLGLSVAALRARGRSAVAGARTVSLPRVAFPPARWRGFAASLALATLVLAWWAPQSLRLAQAWRDSTGSAERLATVHAAARAVATLDARPGCVVVLQGADANPDFAGFSDTLVKAQLPERAAAFDCLVYGSTHPWVALTRRSALPAFAGWPQRGIAGGRRGPQEAGSLAFHFPAALPPGAAGWPGIVRLVYQDGRFVEVGGTTVADDPA